MKYIKYRVKLIEDVKVGSSINQSDNEYSLSYIGGSSVRGGFIANYITQNNIKDLMLDDFGKEKLLKGKVKFSNLYKSVEKARSLPFPCNIYVNKDDIRLYRNEKNINIIDDLNSDISSRDKKMSGDEFCIFQDKSIKTLNVDKIHNLHITKQKDNNNIYRYEAIKKAQEFEGYICLEEECINEIENILQNKIFYFGGSKGSGYGKCEVLSYEAVDKNPEISFFNRDFEDEEYIYIYATSDIILPNENGGLSSRISENYLKEKLNIEKVEYISSSMETRIISGYNSKWGCRYPQVLAIKAGSIFKYRIQGEVEEELVINLENDGIGLRKEEGYGRIVISPELEIKTIETYKRNKKNYIEIDKLSNENKKTLQNILSNIQSTRIERKINERIASISEDMKLGRLSNSQLGNLLNIFSNIKTKSIEDGKNYAREYISGLVVDSRKKEGTLRSNQRVYNSMKSAKILGKNMVDYLEDFIENVDNLERFESQYLNGRSGIKLGDVETNISREYIYIKNIEFIEELLKFMRFKAKAKEVNR